MSFRLLLKIIRDECGDEIASRIEQRARRELAPSKIYIGTRSNITADDVREAADDPRRAAQRLGVHYTTAYRLIR
jgi:hypothetical protein